MTDPIAPLPPEHVVELLSADLDGEFDAAARDLGYAPESARAALASTPGTPERRAALARAREVVAVAPLDDDERSRLVTRALEAAPRDEVAARRRLRFNPKLVGGIAAAVLVVAGIAAALSVDRSGDDASTAASDSDRETTEEFTAGGGGAAADSSQPFALERPDFGDVSDPEVLRDRLAREQQRLGASTSTGEEAGGSYSAGDDAQAEPAPTAAPLIDDACVARQAGALGVAAQPALRGSGTYAGEPVEVIVFATGESFEALVLGADCAVRERVSVPSLP